jgi:hypothetical protein
MSAAPIQFGTCFATSSSSRSRSLKSESSHLELSHAVGLGSRTFSFIHLLILKPDKVYSQMWELNETSRDLIDLKELMNVSWCPIYAAEADHSGRRESR